MYEYNLLLEYELGCHYMNCIEIALVILELELCKIGKSEGNQYVACLICEDDLTN